MLEALVVAFYQTGKIGREIDLKGQVLRFCDMTEVAFDIVAQARKRNFLNFDRDRTRFDLRQIENVVDQVQKVGAR